MAAMCEMGCPGCPTGLKPELNKLAEYVRYSGKAVWLYNAKTIMPGEKESRKIDFEVAGGRRGVFANCLLTDSDRLIGTFDLD